MLFYCLSKRQRQRATKHLLFLAIRNSLHATTHDVTMDADGKILVTDPCDKNNFEEADEIFNYCQEARCTRKWWLLRGWAEGSPSRRELTPRVTVSVVEWCLVPEANYTRVCRCKVFHLV